ncbi:MAG: FtsX-like permease family protein, partial [Mycetocola sp.]
TAYTGATALRAGSALTINGSRSPLSERVLTSVQRADGIDEVAPVYSQPVEVGATAASLLAVAPAALTALGTTAGGRFDTSSAADLIALPPGGPIIPGGTRDITVSATTDSDRPADLSMVIADGFGVQHEVEAAGTYRFALPEGHGDWKVLAFIVRLSEEGPTAFAVTSVVADGVAVDIDGGWVAQGFDPLRAAVTTSPTGAGFSEAQGLTSVRLSPRFGGFTDAVRPPVLISRELADTARLRIGDTVPLALDVRSDPFACVVVGIVPAIPGAASEAAVLLDASLIQAIRARFYDPTPTPQVAWIGTNSTASSLPTLRDVVPAGAAVSALAVDPNRGILGAAVAAMWVGAAGAGVLCFIAVLVSMSVQVRARRNEGLILRALGVTDREVATDRSAEVVIVAIAGLLSGLGAGLIVAKLTISPLARAAVPGSYAAIETVTGFHPFGLFIGLAILLVGLAMSTLLYIRRVIR